MSDGSDTPEPRVVLVDGDDNALGVEGRLRCHRLPGRKHRAFTALLLGADGRALLGRRASGKMLWPDHWDGTVASHPGPDEGYRESGERRLGEELGATCALVESGLFDYRIAFGDVGAENEVCCTLVGALPEGAALAPHPDEISELRWIEVDALLDELDARPLEYCPWLPLALLCLRRELEALPAELRAPLAPLATDGARERLGRSLAAHFAEHSDDTWRLLGADEGAA